MSDVFEHNPADHEDPLPGSTWLVGICGALLLVAIIYGLTALMYRAEQEIFTASVIDEPVLAVRQLRQEQGELLQGPQRTVAIGEGDTAVEAHIIPIQEAMRLVVSEARRANNSLPRNSVPEGPGGNR